MRVFTIAFSDEINHCFRCISKLLTFTRFQSKSKNKYLFSLFDDDHNENAEKYVRSAALQALPKKTTKIAKTSQNKSCQVKSLKTCKFSDECNLLSCESEGCDVVDNV